LVKTDHVTVMRFLEQARRRSTWPLQAFWWPLL